MLRVLLALLFVTAVSTPAWAQVDIAGEWARDNHEDQPHRAPGAELGDYTGMPINAAARRKAETWDASVLSQPEQQARPHPAQYSMRGPRPNLRITKIADPVSGRLIAYQLNGLWGRADRVIWMDGRPHPSEYAEHTWGGFSTGVWQDGKLVVTTTHMKTAFINRNGVPSSYEATMTEYFFRHGDHLMQATWIDDPVYLEEPFVRTNNFSYAPDQHIDVDGPMEIVDELAGRPRGWVPSWPIGTEHREFAERFDIPFEATRGGAAHLYPEYMDVIEELRREEAARQTTTSSR